MFSIFSDNLGNSSIIDVIQLYWNSLLLYFTDLFISLRESESKRFLKFIGRLPDSFYFNDFQWKLLKTFSIAFLVNLILIILVWRIYGKSICERFMKLSTLREIEELKASVSKLKLPKEHTPRI